MAKATKESVAYKELETRDRPSSRKMLREVKAPRHIAKTVTLRQVLLLVVIAAASVAIIYNYMILTQLTDQASQKKQQLEDLKSEYTYLEAKEENMYTLSEIEEYAQQKLNMIKMDSSQVEYIELSNPDQIEVSGSSRGISSTVSLIAKGFHAIWDYIK